MDEKVNSRAAGVITTLVLGAGASLEYGYPSGTDLVEKIESKLGEEQDHLSREILERLKIYRPYSIDDFIFQFQDQPNYADHLKSIIAEILFECEEKGRRVPREKDFYGFLCKNIPRDKYDQYRIITFNYDRSLEFHLMQYQRAFHNTDMKAAEALKPLRIVHIHGRLPELPGENVDTYKLKREREQFAYGFGREGYGVTFAGRADTGDYDDEESDGPSGREDFAAREAFEHRRSSINGYGRQNLKFVHEADPHNEAKEILEGSQRIFFLGFAYHDRNMELLGLDWKEKRQKKIRGTSLGLRPVRLNELNSKYKAIDLKPLTVMDFFQEYCSLNNPEADC